MVLTVLMVAEKPSIADALSRALCEKGEVKKSYRTSNAVGVFEYKSQFMGQEAFFKVTSTTGHVLTTDFSGKYNSWDLVDPTELFEAPIVKKEANPKGRVLKHLSNEAKGVDVLVLWLDCDREGENICFEVINAAVSEMKKDRPNLCKLKSRGVPPNVFRAKFSSLVPQDLRKAFNTSLGIPNICESESVDARQEIDLKIGVAYTRFMTKYFLNRFGDLDSNLVSYGPCQLPTLWFCVNQKNEHDLFQPQTFHTISATLRTTQGAALYAGWEGGRLFDEKLARAMAELMNQTQSIKLKSRKSSSRKVSRPLPLNTVNMLKKASSVYGIGPQRAMHVAEQLYLRGLITYPRTESTAFAPAFNFSSIVNSLQNSIVANAAVTCLSQSRDLKARKGTDAGDHPPITPCGTATHGSLDSDQEKIYRLVAETFLQSICSDATYSDQRLTFEMENCELGVQTFSLKESVLVDPGFMAITQSTTRSANVQVDLIATLKEGDKLEIVQVKLEQGQTSKPPLLTESSLLTLMEKNGIGTDASMATHIQNVLDRNYVFLTGTNRTLCPTKLGLALCKGLEQVDPELTRPVVRSIIEKQCGLVSQGKADKTAVINHVLNEFAIKFQYLLRHVMTVDALFEISFTTIANSGTPFSRCGQCKRYLSHVSKKPQRLICQQCSLVLKLPIMTNVRTISDYRCPFDDFEVILAVEKSGRAYTMCPMCFNNPPYEGFLSMRCIDCPNDTLEGSRNRAKIDECFKDDCNGVLYLQDWPGVKKGLVCSQCSFFQSLSPESVKTIVKMRPAQECETCGWALVRANLKGDEIISGCLACTEELRSLVDDFGTLRANRSKGRGRGRGRRGANTDPKLTFDRF